MSEKKQLHGLWREKEDFIKRIRDLCSRQYEIIASQSQEDEEKVRQVEELLIEKDEIISNINDIDKKILSFQEVKEESNKVDGEYRKEIEEVKENILKMLEEIKEFDEINNKKLSELMEQVQRRVKDLQAGRRTFNTYNRRPQQLEGFFVDNKK